MKSYTLSELITGLDVTVKGDPNCLISGVCPIQQSQPGKVTFLTNALYRKHLAATQASAVILSEDDAAECPVTAIISRNPYFTYAKIAEYFAVQKQQACGIHATAIIGDECQIDPTAVIGPYCVIGSHVRIAAHAVIGAGSFIGDHVVIAEAAQLEARVTLYHSVKIGKRTRIWSGAVIGRDGFGFANQKGVWHKVPQLGTVEIGDDVDIGANTTIDRGAIENTVIENGVKLDNLIQIGHNVKVGANSIIAGGADIAGSVIFGKNCIVGGHTAFVGHITIADNVMINGGTIISKSIPAPGIYASGLMGVVTNLEFRKNSARFNRLEILMQRVKTLESAVKEMTERNET